MVTALVVDDAKVDQRLAGNLLSVRADLSVLYADDGRHALDVMATRRPDVVVTDLQMPRMDGLELVEAVRQQYPDVPVVLMTAHGSEQIAADALKRGAASYVPKRCLSQDLAGTVERVLAVVGLERHQQHALQCLQAVETRFVLDNDDTRARAVIIYLRQDLSRMNLCDPTMVMRVGIALDEALSNAIHHGNLEMDSDLRQVDEQGYRALLELRRTMRPYCERRVEVTARLTHERAVYTIRDEGRGFDPRTLPDPTDPTNLEKTSGRGLLLIRTFMDEVHHNDRGTEITMIKRRENGSVS